MDPGLLERITARPAELGEREEVLARELAEVRAGWDGLAVAERVVEVERVSEQLAGERASAAPVPGQAGGRGVMLVAHRTPEMEETVFPPDCRRILAPCGGPPDRSWPGRSPAPRESMSACGTSWCLCAGSWSNWSTAVGCANCPGAASLPACDLICCPRQLGAGVTMVPPAAVGMV
ncbi:hypothetical protein [Streptomyces sp. NPDC058268]|uniref:hypothetical protein n=1 Tax=Streptomyces sp. NPDC058268 TaxID=3346413 RepID=UPI0036E9B111